MLADLWDPTALVRVGAWPAHSAASRTQNIGVQCLTRGYSQRPWLHPRGRQGSPPAPPPLGPLNLTPLKGTSGDHDVVNAPVVK